MKNLLFLDTALPLLEENSYKVNETTKRNINTVHFKVTENESKLLKKEVGDYYTIHYFLNDLFNNKKFLIKEVEKNLKKFLKNYYDNGKVLIVGLGNSSITADSLGPKTTKKTIATNHYHDFMTIPKVALFVPEVIGKTGISSYQLIKMLVKKIEPDVIIMIDSLVTNNDSRLNQCVEITDTGIVPGGAIHDNKEINKQTFNIPIIAIGSPLVIEKNSIFYTTPDIEEIVDNLSDVIATVLNNMFLM